MSAQPFTLLPAVDVADGRAVRLVRGEAGTETSYGEPLAAALAWQADGAEWIHLVDLDAAFGRGSNRDLLAGVVRALDVQVELSGGIRDDDSLDAALATGATRVNLGTAALEDPDWVRRAVARVGDRVAVGLDVRADGAGSYRVSARGWTTDGGDLFETLTRLEADGCARYVVTDVHRDGTLTGPNLPGIETMAREAGLPITAAGGISILDDLTRLAALEPLGVDEVIVGKALYEKRFTLAQAREALANATAG